MVQKNCAGSPVDPLFLSLRLLPCLVPLVLEYGIDFLVELCLPPSLQALTFQQDPLNKNARGTKWQDIFAGFIKQQSMAKNGFISDACERLVSRTVSSLVSSAEKVLFINKTHYFQIDKR